MRKRNRFHSTVLALCSAQLFFFISFARHVDKNIESSVVLTETSPGVHLHPSLYKKKVFTHSVHFSHHLISSCSVFRWDSRVWNDILEVVQKKPSSLIHREVTPWSRSGRSSLDFVRRVNLGRRWAAMGNKPGCLVMRFWLRQKSLKSS